MSFDGAGAATLSTFVSTAPGRRELCAGCGTHMRVHGQSGDATVGIPAGTLDGDPPLMILGHMFTAGAVGWTSIDDDPPRHAGWPPGFGT